MAREEKVRVLVRVRPALAHEPQAVAARCVRVLSTDGESNTSLDAEAYGEPIHGEAIELMSRPSSRMFTFDSCLSARASQEHVFQRVGVPMTDEFFTGFNATIFAYGQTASGKSFTMVGPSEGTDDFLSARRGLIPRVFDYLFSLLLREKRHMGSRVEHLLSCSYLEIYCERIYDLLDPDAANIQAREDIERGVYVTGASEHQIACTGDALELLGTGAKNRRVASTALNRESSRSHSLLIISMQRTETNNGVSSIRSSKLNLVDLAGSERQRDTLTTGLRLQEANKINQSLTALGKVIMALGDVSQGRERHVHYRDSKLTFLLKDCLGGNSHTYIICNVSPLGNCFGETLSTLKFAQRAKYIKNSLTQNINTRGTIESLARENMRLKDKIREMNESEVESERRRSFICVTPTKESRLRPSNRSPGVFEDEAVDLLRAALKREEDLLSQVRLHEEQMEAANDLCRRLERQCNALVLRMKLRQREAENLRKQLNCGVSDLNALRSDGNSEEIEALKEQLRAPPEVARKHLELLALKAKLGFQETFEAAINDARHRLVEAERINRLWSVRFVDSTQDVNCANDRRVVELEAQFAALQKACEIRLAEARRNRQSAIVSLERDTAVADSTERLEKALEETSQQLELSQARESRIEEQYNAALVECNRLEQVVARIERDKASTELRLQLLQDDLDSLNEDLRFQNEEQVVRLTRELEEARKEMQDGVERADDAQRKLSLISNERTIFQSELADENSCLVAEKNRLNDLVRELLVELDAKEEQLETLKVKEKQKTEELSSLRELFDAASSRVSSLKDDLLEARDEVQMFASREDLNGREALAMITTATTCIDQLSLENTALITALQNTEAHVDSLQCELHSWLLEFTNRDSLDAHSDALSKLIHESENSNAQLKRQIHIQRVALMDRRLRSQQELDAERDKWSRRMEELSQEEVKLRHNAEQRAHDLEDRLDTIHRLIGMQHETQSEVVAAVVAMQRCAAQRDDLISIVGDLQHSLKHEILTSKARDSLMQKYVDVVEMLNKRLHMALVEWNERSTTVQVVHPITNVIGACVEEARIESLLRKQLEASNRQLVHSSMTAEGLFAAKHAESMRASEITKRRLNDLEEEQKRWDEERRQILDEKARLQESEAVANSEAVILRSLQRELEEENVSIKSSLQLAMARGEELSKENQKLSGHHNIKQRIQHHQKIKEENTQLRKEIALLKRQITREVKTGRDDDSENVSENMNFTDEVRIKTYVREY